MNSTTRPPVDPTNSQYQTTIIYPTTTENTKINDTAVTATDPSIRGAKNNQFPTEIDKEMTMNSTTTRPPVNTNSQYKTKTIYPTTTVNTGTNDIAVTTTDPSIRGAKRTINF